MSVFDGMRLVANVGEVSAECWIMALVEVVGFFLTATIAQCRYSKRSALGGRAATPPGKETRGVCAPRVKHDKRMNYCHNR